MLKNDRLDADEPAAMYTTPPMRQKSSKINALTESGSRGRVVLAGDVVETLAAVVAAVAVFLQRAANCARAF